MGYQATTHQSDLLVKDEDARRLKVRIGMLQDDNAALKDKVGLKDTRIHHLVLECDDLRIQLDSTAERHRRLEDQLRIQAREHAKLKVAFAMRHGGLDGSWLTEQTDRTLITNRRDAGLR